MSTTKLEELSKVTLTCLNYLTDELRPPKFWVILDTER